MKLPFWFLAAAAVAGFVFWLRSWRRRQAERERAAEERLASFMAQARAAVAPVDPAQKLLFDAAAKAGEANEPALSVQLYARLLFRFPDGAFAPQARAGAELQRQKLAKR
jgi:hypothetical protein